MPTKYVARKFNPGKEDHNKINTLINLSSLSLNASQSILQTSLALGASETNNAYASNSIMQYGDDIGQDNAFAKYRDITKNNSQSYAYYDLSYSQRREQLRSFSQIPTVSFVLDTISDETIILDENNYFAQLDLKLLKLKLNSEYKGKNGETADDLINNCQKAFKIIYSTYGWDKSNDAWNYFKKFLIEGYIAFEIVVDNLMHPTRIIGIREIDPITLEPDIEVDPETNKEVKVWYQYRGDAELERKIPDSNIIYISWSSGMYGESARVSYLEGLIRSYTMLSQLENSRMVWNIMNAQKRMKVTVPVGNISQDKAKAKINEVKADWNEETTIDEISGEMVVNGSPKFSFTKTYFFPKRDNGEMSVEEISSEGYDMSDIAPLKYFWRRFILETKVPANRFMIDPAAEGAHPLGGDDASITREEYAFSRFISRIRVIYREILLKPLWVQICLMMPELASSELLKQCIGIVFNEENMFVQAKERTALKQGAEIIGTLSQLMLGENKPFFSMKFLIQKFLGMSDEDLALNEKYKEGEIIERLEQAKTLKQHKEIGRQAQEQAGNGAPGEMDFGEGGGDTGGGDFGGGGSFDDTFGGGDTGGGDFGGGDEVFSGGDTGMGSGATEIADTGGGEDFS